MTRHRLSLESKYVTVGGLLAGLRGTLLDVGARDGVLRNHIDQVRLSYTSADRAPGLDLIVDLERELPLADRAFDVVVALDVLEHVDGIHAAFLELTRIARTDVIIALPTLASWPRRWSFLRHGHLGTRKYELHPDATPDRHRWLTTYEEVDRFIRQNADKAGYVVTDWVEQLERLPGPLTRMYGTLIALGFCRDGRFTQRSIYRLTRASPR